MIWRRTKLSVSAGDRSVHRSHCVVEDVQYRFKLLSVRVPSWISSSTVQPRRRPITWKAFLTDPHGMWGVFLDSLRPYPSAGQTPVHVGKDLKVDPAKLDAPDSPPHAGGEYKVTDPEELSYLTAPPHAGGEYGGTQLPCQGEAQPPPRGWGVLTAQVLEEREDEPPHAGGEYHWEQEYVTCLLSPPRGWGVPLPACEFKDPQGGFCSLYLGLGGPGGCALKVLA